MYWLPKKVLHILSIIFPVGIISDRFCAINLEKVTTIEAYAKLMAISFKEISFLCQYAAAAFLAFSLSLDFST